MSSSYKKQHYVPQTYLEAWNDDSNRIYVYQKNDNRLYRHSKVDKVLYENDLYTKTIDDVVILNEEEKKDIFSSLNGYKIYYKSDSEEKILITHDDLATYYFDFDNWTITRQDGSVISKKALKDAIDNKRLTVLEEEWKIVENDWAILRSNIENCIKEEKLISRTEINSILEFLVTQEHRTPKALQKCTDLVEKILSPVKDLMGDIYEVESQSVGRAYFKDEIIKFQNKDSKSNILKEIDQLKQLQMAFFKPIGRKFITSDSPVLTIIDDNFIRGRYNGIYFPISPNLMVALYRGNNDKYIVGTLNSNTVRRFNARIKKESLKYYITNYKQ